MNEITIWFDGGCHGNPGWKYGSYLVQLDHAVILDRSRVKFGWGTNNEAEFNAMEMALRETLDWMADRWSNPADYQVRIITDSMILRNRMMKRNVIHGKKEWHDASERMYRLACGCLELCRRFGSFRVEWQGREANVERFGH